MDIPKETEGGGWGIHSESSCNHNIPSDATLFSSSLPVLPHQKLQLYDIRDVFPLVDDPLGEGDVESCAIGNLLPDDEDELLAGIMDDLDLSELPNTMEDVDDYDLFGSGGGMELEADALDYLSMGMPKIPISRNLYGVGTVAGEHPYGEHPSRTLFVRNINSNVDDSELRALFEQYGDIRTLYTACKHRGFVMISYYDIRAARMAMRALQSKPLRRRKLDIHFSIPKDNPSEKDINQGTLVVFNLDPSVSNDDLHRIFGAHGEIKEIRETPHKRHHKFIEFYDIRAAEAALKALNRCEIAGKCIKVEPSRPGGARRNLMLQFTQELEHDDLHGFRHLIGSPMANSPPGNWLHLNSPAECKSPVFESISPTRSSHLSGLASVLNSQGPSSKITPIGREQGKFGHIGSNIFQQSHLIQEPMLDRYTGNLSSVGSTTSNGCGIETLSGSEFLWGSPNSRSEHSSSSVWSKSSIGNQFSVDTKSHGFPYSSRIEQHHGHCLHVGSAPSGVHLEKQFGIFSDRDTLLMNTVGFQGTGNMSVNGGSFMSKLGNHGMVNVKSVAENGRYPSGYRMMSSPRLSPGLNPGRYASGFEGFAENGRTRRTESNAASQVECRKQFQLDLEKIRCGEDSRTTLMIKNIPNKYTAKMLLAAIDERNKGTYDFVYLPIDFKNKCNVGYAFINMLSPDLIIPFYEAFNGKKWEKFNSEKVASLAYARIQGKTALLSHFQNSSLMNEDMRCRPIIFDKPNGSDSIEQLNEGIDDGSDES